MDTQVEVDPGRGDTGSAMILMLMVMALVTALATTVAVVTINNLQSSWRAQQAGAALNAADAGIAQAMSYLRASGVRSLRCAPTCSANPWGNEANPTSVTLSGTARQGYATWIQPVAPFPASNPGLYRIHSIGTAGGAASRAVSSDVRVATTAGVPKGVFARTLSGGGTASVARESIFSTGCVYERSKIDMVEGEIDLAYGIPVAVHSSQVITDSNGSGQYCPGTNKPIHPAGATSQCNPSFPYDQDKLGRTLADTSCASTATSYPSYYGPRDLDADGSNDVLGSFVKDDATLFRLFGIRRPALTQAEIDRLRTVAQSQGNYWTSSTGWTSPVNDAQAVMFFDLARTNLGGTVNLNNVTGFGRVSNVPDSGAACESKSLVIIVEGGNVTLNSNQQLFASLFLTSSYPNGQVQKANGNASFIGTIYADTVNLVGTVDLSLDGCFLANFSPALLDLTTENYREEDRGLS
jgi:hypothetical protein